MVARLLTNVWVTVLLMNVGSLSLTGYNTIWTLSKLFLFVAILGVKFHKFISQSWSSKRRLGPVFWLLVVVLMTDGKTACKMPLSPCFLHWQSDVHVTSANFQYWFPNFIINIHDKLMQSGKQRMTY